MVYSEHTTQFPDKVAIQTLIDELKAYADNIATGDIDLSNYVTTDELQAKLDALDFNIDLSSYATKEELATAIQNIDLSDYALKGEIPSLDGYAKTTDIPSVPTKVSELENDKGYLTEHQDLSSYALKSDIPNISLDDYATKIYVDESITNASIGGEVDLSNYVTKDTVYTKEQTNALIPTVPTKVSELENDKGYLTKHQDLSAYALKTDVPNISLDGYATETYVDNKVASIPTTDLSNYYTKDETYNKEEVNALVTNSGGTSSSGGGGTAITYAYDTEIATGETWIDGKPIYLRVYHVDALAEPYSIIGFENYFTSVQPFADTFISVTPVWKKENGNKDTFNGNVLQYFQSVSGSSGSVAVSSVNKLLAKTAWVQVWQSSSSFGITVCRGENMYTYAVNVFIKYTKL